jgi:hypothetical protein
VYVLQFTLHLLTLLQLSVMLLCYLQPTAIEQWQLSSIGFSGMNAA